MMTVIKAENISKAYQLGEFSTGAVSQDIQRWLIKLRGGEDPFLKISETQNHTITGNTNLIWSLKDINFEIEQGEAVGIIGRNGAGKSTLLKILSRVTTPTTGSIKVKGRIASLLEVGTGFHPELTGRENIFLNGAILGMRKQEVREKFDEIVDFSGVERYIDTPVKRYSSGMYVRLAFAVAAHLESEILIIDEVLAVGDAEFQKKCLSKMGEVSKGHGRTVLFVSHNMSAITALCNSIIYLKDGKLVFNGEKEKGIHLYRSSSRKLGYKSDLLSLPATQNYGPRNHSSLRSIELRNENDEICASFSKSSQLKVRIAFDLYRDIADLEIGYTFVNYNGNVFGGVINIWDKFQSYYSKGFHTVESTIPGINLLPGKYSITIWIKKTNEGIDNEIEDAIDFEVISGNVNGEYINYDKYPHLGFHHESEWSLIN